MTGVTNWYPGVFGYSNPLKKQELPFKSAIKPPDARHRLEGDLPQEPEEPKDELERPDPQKEIEGPKKPELPPGRKQIAAEPFTGPHAPDTPGKTAIESGPNKSPELDPSFPRGPYAPDPPRGPAIEGRPSRTDRQRALPGPAGSGDSGGGIQVEQLPINREQPNRPALPAGRTELTSTAGHLHNDHAQALERVTQDNAEDRGQAPLEMSRPKAIERRKLLDGRPLGAIKMSSPWERQHPGSKTGRISEGHVGNLVQNQASREGGFSDLATREEGNLYYPKGEHEPKFPTEAPRGR